MSPRAFFPSILALSVLSTSACTITPESYAKTSLKESCKYVKQCEEEAWEQAGYDSISDCREDLEMLLEEDGQDYQEAFAEQCQDYDRSSARKCLKAFRKLRRDCGSLETENNNEDCAAVCGPPDTTTEMDSGAEQLNPEFGDSLHIAIMLDVLERGGHVDLGLHDDDLSSEP